MRAVAVAVAISLLMGVAGSASVNASPLQQPRAIAPCSEAIYTSAADAPPAPVRAIRVGPAVFNSLAGLTSPREIDKPTKSNPFYRVKSPLTILALAGQAVTLTIVRDQMTAAVIYNRRWLSRLADWHYRFADVPRSVRLQLCRDDERKQVRNTQYAGGFLLRKLGCITIQVQVVGESRPYRSEVPIGIVRC